MANCMLCTEFDSCPWRSDPNAQCSAFKRKPMTNGDNLRTMSDEELAEWYFNDFFKAPYCRKEECYENSPCEDCLLEWLKEEVET